MCVQGTSQAPVRQTMPLVFMYSWDLLSTGLHTFICIALGTIEIGHKCCTEATSLFKSIHKNLGNIYISGSPTLYNFNMVAEIDQSSFILQMA